MTDNKSLEENIGEEYYDHSLGLVGDIGPFIDLATTMSDMSKEGRINDMRRVLVNSYVRMRTKDIQKISFHSGIPVEDIEGWLRSKD